MGSFIDGVKNGLHIESDARKAYRALQKHLNTMPVGYPATITGVELRILQHIFTAEEAQAALNIGWQLETFEEIFERARLKGYKEEQFRELLESMTSKGSVFLSVSDGQKRYACHPLIVGMFEMQGEHLSASLYMDLRNYMRQRFAIEYYTTKVRQMRVIPIHASVTPQLSIAVYDDIRQIVDQTKDRIGITQCICKNSKDMIGKHCQVTKRREVCIGFRDFHDMYHSNGWGRTISKQEAFEILDKNEKEGLVLMPSSMQNPQFVCSCCACCCGIMELVGMMPRSVDFVESNYNATLNAETCTGCGVCKKRCQMQAIQFDDKKAVFIDERKCIGCGVCVPTCKPKSLSLVRKEKEFVPPKDMEELYSIINQNKRSTMGKYTMMLKALLGREV
jgi:NAD-dependent dihydropyrimidine dehydrogenase PreA subunit